MEKNKQVSSQPGELISSFEWSEDGEGNFYPKMTRDEFTQYLKLKAENEAMLKYVADRNGVKYARFKDGEFQLSNDNESWWNEEEAKAENEKLKADKAVLLEALKVVQKHYNEVDESGFIHGSTPEFRNKIESAIKINQ